MHKNLNKNTLTTKTNNPESKYVLQHVLYYSKQLFYKKNASLKYQKK